MTDEPRIERYWHQAMHWPWDDDELDFVQNKLAETASRWLEANGYEELEMGAHWQVNHPAMVGDPTDVRLTIQCRPRLDGVWGDLRAALAEDGLLPERDRAWLPEPVRSPAVGEFRVSMDPSSDGAYVMSTWDGTRWVSVDGVTGVSFGPLGPLSIEDDRYPSDHGGSS